MTNKGAWAAGAAFAAFSGMVALGWLHEADLRAQRTTQEHPSGFLDHVLDAFSFLGTMEIAGTVLLVLLAGLFLRGHRALAGRILAVFVATGASELVIKFYMPQVPIPEGVGRTEDYHMPLTTFDSPHSYPSGHILRGVIVFGALYLLSGNRLARAGSLAVLAGIAASRIYFGTHWAGRRGRGAVGIRSASVGVREGEARMEITVNRPQHDRAAPLSPAELPRGGGRLDYLLA